MDCQEHVNAGASQNTKKAKEDSRCWMCHRFHLYLFPLIVLSVQEVHCFVFSGLAAEPNKPNLWCLTMLELKVL